MNRIHDCRMPTRFWEKIKPSDDGCWIWTACKDDNGYPVYWYEKRNHRAYRVSYLMFVGSLFENMELTHKCKKLDCVNPDHLEQKTYKQIALERLRHKNENS